MDQRRRWFTTTDSIVTRLQSQTTNMFVIDLPLLLEYDENSNNSNSHKHNENENKSKNRIRVWIPRKYYVVNNTIRSGYVQMLADNTSCIYYPTHDYLFDLLDNNSWTTTIDDQEDSNILGLNEIYDKLSSVGIKLSNKTRLRNLLILDVGFDNYKQDDRYCQVIKCFMPAKDRDNNNLGLLYSQLDLNLGCHPRLIRLLTSKYYN
jgi:hypothetical protein